MARHLWSVLCYKGVVDQQTQQTSLLDVLETVEVVLPGHLAEQVDKRFQAAQPMNLVTLWGRSEPGRGEIANSRTEILFPNGDLAYSIHRSMDLSEFKRYRAILSFDALPVFGSGTYSFNVFLKVEDEWEQVASLPLEVTVTVEVSERKPPKAVRAKAGPEKPARKARRQK